MTASLSHIQSPCVAALTWTLTDTLGEVLDELQDPVEFLVGGEDLLAKIEEALQGQDVGSTVQLQLEPQDAFGDFQDQWVFLEPRALFPSELEEGMGFEGLPPGCNPDAPRNRLYTVTDIYPEHVVLDGNHPLAGIALRVRITVRGIREATEQELEGRSAGTGFFKLGTA